MKKIIATLKKVKKSGWIMGIFLLVIEYVFYLLGNTLSNLFNIAPISPKIDIIDNNIKMVKIFIIPYIYSYAFWLFAPIVVSLTNKKNFYNYAIGLLLAYFVGFLFFTFMPTYINRVDEGLYDALGNDILSKLIRLIYNSDGKEYGYNLFPSYHCLISTYCYLGIRKQKEISTGFKAYTLIMAILICMSTVFIKQHYFLDIIGGVLIAIICYILTNIINPAKYLIKENVNCEKE